MTNQRLAANLNASSTIPRSLPLQSPAAVATGLATPSVPRDNSPPKITTSNANGEDVDISQVDSGSDRSSEKESVEGAASDKGSERGSEKSDYFMNAPPHISLGQSAHPSSLASALKAIDNGSQTPSLANGPLPIRRPPSSDDSPYTKSISSTAPGSPRIPPVRQNSGSQTPRVRPHATTLSIPGMTRSIVSPDGRIADRDVAAKLVIVMVGLPARGKSYITKKLRRYLSWQQHNTKIFNVGNRRRVHGNLASPMKQRTENPMDAAKQAANRLLDEKQRQPGPTQQAQPKEPEQNKQNGENGENGEEDHSAKFFDPKNSEASQVREALAMETLDELLDYLLNGGGAVGILDATNSTIERRQRIFDHIKAREPKLGILFIESVCEDPELLEANMRLKLSGPDYRDKDPVKSLEDFKERVKAYESAYVPLGEYEEKHGMQYIKMIDVGKKLTHFGLGGFLSSNIAHYLSSFNLSPRQIWITRHGQSIDNQLGKIGGNSELSDRGHLYSHALYRFITHKRKEWTIDQKNRVAQSSFPPLPGDESPPYPELRQEIEEKNTCVWTSMLRRSIQTAEYFEADEDYDVKNWEMLNELNAGIFEGLTYDEIARTHTDEYAKRQRDKLHYVYPGLGGEGYLQIISRLRDLVREIERIKDHLVIIGHRSVCRVLMAYFMDLTRDDIADLDMPLGMLYAIEPKPYGIEFHAYKYNEREGWFDEIPDYRPQKTVDRSA
ncbi:6-phosphofructo-2-kinase [Xylariomycetidae sp. FL0641]|nr:6-phosphofructo-2-kinase [Xylariomycetidae sp. FL0641]